MKWADRIGSLSVVCANSRQLASAVGAPLARRNEAEEAWGHVSNLAHWLQQKYRDVTVLKAALPLVASEEFLSRAQQEAEAEHIALASFAQVGVGIVHLCALQERLSANLAGGVARLRQAMADFGGTLVIEHCPLALKGGEAVWGVGGDDLECHAQNERLPGTPRRFFRRDGSSAVFRIFHRPLSRQRLGCGSSSFLFLRHVDSELLGKRSFDRFPTQRI